MVNYWLANSNPTYYIAKQLLPDAVAAQAKNFRQ
jgi:hypothetical protein